MGTLNNLWSGAYRPLRVRADMTGPVCFLQHEGLPLDGLLEYAAFRLNWPPVLQYAGHLPRVTDRDPANFILPIKRIGHKCDHDWYWSASWATFPEGFEQDRAYWNKRFDGADATLGEHINFMGHSEKISVKSGRYKGYHMPMALGIAPVIEWFAVGAVDGIAKLLSEITHLGKKRSQGLGEIRCWSIWPMREDWSCWRDGKPMRALPVIEGNYTRAATSIRAPYWSPSRRRLCVVPAP